MRKGGLAEYYVNKMIEELSLKGEKLINEAISKKDYVNRTFNLHDSYGSAVYLDGKLIESSIRISDPTMAKKAKKWYGNTISGADEVVEFLREYRSVGKGLSLLVVAAMPYASILENGEAGLRRKYKVISGAKGMMNKLAEKYEGSVEVVTTSRK